MSLGNTETDARLEQLLRELESIRAIVTENQELLKELAGEDSEEIMFD